MSEHKTLVEVQHLQQYFPAGGVGKNRKYVQAVDDVSFAIRKGETLGLVGESGCGKTTTGRTLLRLYEPTGGKIYYDGNLLFDKENKIAVDMLPYRRRMQIVFQDPFSSLDPRMTVRALLDEPFSALMPEMMSCERLERMKALLAETGLEASALERYPHEFSGGQRQRIAIARALAAEPRVIVCDEPTSALDVSVQAQILNLLMRLKVERGLSYLLITHNFGVVEFAADRIAVMKDGRIVETGPARDVLEHPQTAYAKMHLASVPRL